MTDYGLENITDAVACGPDIWVLEGPPLSGGTWLVELDAADGRLLRTVPVPSGIPDGNGVAVAVDGEDLWVANTGDTGSLTELSARDGRLVRIVSGSRYAFSPSAVTAEGGDIWVADDPSGENAGWVTEVSSASGALVRVVSGARYGLMLRRRLLLLVRMSGWPTTGLRSKVARSLSSAWRAAGGYGRR